MRRAASTVSTFVRRFSTEAYAVAPYRSMIYASAEQKQAWAEADVKLHSEMRKHVPAALQHNGEETFDDHLVGVQSVLRSWNAPEHLTHAALFHSIYGTEGFQGFSVPLSQRAELAALIGPKAERLAWIFCMVDRATVDATVLPPAPHPAAAIAKDTSAPLPTFYSRPELGAFPIPLKSHEEWLDFLTLSLADWLEQVEGAAQKEVPLPIGGILWPMGEAWAYRRDAYRAMSELLGTVGVAAAPKMYAEVFNREPEWSRNIHQPKTPAVSLAAVAALEALESAKLDFA